MKYLMGIDNGGTFVKAAVFDEDGKQFSVAGCPLRTIAPAPGYAERDMEALFDANVAVIRQALEKSGIDPARLAGVSLSGHGKGLYLVGHDGKPVRRGILSQDTRAWEYVKNWNADGTKEKVYPKTYQDILTCQPVSLMAWLRDHEPEALEGARHLFSVKDYVRFRLTGEAHGEYTDFSGGNLINLSTGAYDEALLGYFGLAGYAGLLPPLKRSGEICGGVSEAAARLTGLPVGTPVAAGMFDVDACGLASGLVDENGMCMIAGTWSINEYIAKQPVTDGTVALNSMYAIPGNYLVEESSPTSAGNLEWFLREMMPGEGGAPVYEEANALVESIAPLESRVVFLPFLHGSNDDALAKAAWVGLTAYHEKKHMLRAVYEGIVFSHAVHVDRLLRSRKAPASIRLSGGAANSPVWVQMFADTLQIPIETAAEKELGCLGAAMAAGVAVGVYPDYAEAASRVAAFSKTIYPREEAMAAYREKYDTYRMVVDAMRGVWPRFQ